MMRHRSDFLLEVLARGDYVVRGTDIWSYKRKLNKLKPRHGKKGKGYLMVALCLGGKVLYFPVHQVIWTASNGRIPTGLEVNHIDGNKINNELSNLELCTRQENAQHAYDIGLAEGDETLDKFDVPTILMVHALRNEGNTNTDVGQVLGLSKKQVSYIYNKDYKCFS